MEVAELFLEKNHNLKTYMTTYRVTKNKERNNNLKKIAKSLWSKTNFHSFQSMRFVLGQMKVTSPSLQKQQKQQRLY